MLRLPRTSQANFREDTITASQFPDTHPEPNANALILAVVQANGFDVPNIALNRQGKLSRAQRQMITRRLFNAVGIFGLLVILTVAVFLYQNICGIVIFFNLIVFNLNLFASGLWAALDLLETQIIAVEGTLKRDIKVNRAKHRFWSRNFFCIGNLEFEVSAEVYNTLTHDIPCRLYYLRSSETILNVELISPVAANQH